MRHRISGRKFNRDSAHRKALFNNLSKALLKYEQIITTLPKAKDLRPYIEKMLTLGKKGTVAARRQLFADLRDRDLVSKVFGPLATRYASRNGGYTRIVKCGFRKSDAAPIAVIELLDRDVAAKGKKVKSSTDRRFFIKTPGADPATAELPGAPEVSAPSADVAGSDASASVQENAKA